MEQRLPPSGRDMVEDILNAFDILRLANRFGLLRILGAPAPWMDGLDGAARKRAAAVYESVAHMRAVAQEADAWRDGTHRYRETAGGEIRVVTNPLPDASVLDLPINRTRYAAPDILYVGMMTYTPNTRAAASLVTTFAPALGDDVRITLAGGNADRIPEITDGQANVSVVANPPDLRPVLASAAFSVMPIRQGGGTRLKALEAMAAGLVVIATAKAVEGLGLEPDIHFIQAETDTELLAAYLSLRDDPDRCVALATRARQLVEARYSPGEFTRQVHDALTGIAPIPTARRNRAAPGPARSARRVPAPGPDAAAPDGPTVAPFLMGTFHKTGTVLVSSILKCLSEKRGLSLWNSQRGSEPPSGWDAMFDWHSDFARHGVDPRDYPAVIVVRDPRDVVISSAHYHMTSKEDWLHAPSERFDGRTYQEAINRLPDMRARFLFEMDHSAAVTIRRMRAAKADPALSGARFVKIEDLMTDVDLVAFRALFTHLGFAGQDLQSALLCAAQNSVFSGKRSAHMRDPRPAQWVETFDDALHAEFGRRFGDVAAELGYGSAG